MRIFKSKRFKFWPISILIILATMILFLDKPKEFIATIVNVFVGSIHYIAHCLMIASQDLIYPASAIVILSFAILYVPFLSKLKPFVIHTMMLPVFFSVALVGIVSCYFGI